MLYIKSIEQGSMTPGFVWISMNRKEKNDSGIISHLECFLKKLEGVEVLDITSGIHSLDMGLKCSPTDISMIKSYVHDLGEEVYNEL